MCSSQIVKTYLKINQTLIFQPLEGAHSMGPSQPESSFGPGQTKSAGAPVESPGKQLVGQKPGQSPSTKTTIKMDLKNNNIVGKLLFEGIQELAPMQPIVSTGPGQLMSLPKHCISQKFWHPAESKQDFLY